MSGIRMAKGLGWFSIALGIAELAYGRRMSRAMGLDSPALVRVFGAREVASGIGVLAYPDNSGPIWNRVGGDAMDAAVLTAGLLTGRRPRGAALALAMVLGVAVLDVAVATSMDGRARQALATARRTRVKRIANV